MAGKKVLIVDDGAELREVISSGLEIAGFEPLTAEDGLQGLQAARKHKPDLILLDINMPGMDGGEVGQALKSDPATAGIPVIYITALAGDGTSKKEGVREIGGRLFISKPFRLETIIEAAQKYT
ncbi:MAG TPA: response regulator [Elusimicrobiota bacterium]|nr:response regulator [Elusimicrobiota bacterium]